jgi:hypothetical protein
MSHLLPVHSCWHQVVVVRGALLGVVPVACGAGMPLSFLLQHRFQQLASRMESLSLDLQVADAFLQLPDSSFVNHLFLVKLFL